jgi:hypothetical protein
MVAAGFVTLLDAARSTSRAVAARERVVGAAVGVGCGAAVAALMWVSFWYGRVDWEVALVASTLLAAVILAVPLRAVAGAFALTVSLSVTGFAVGYFVTTPASATAPGAAASSGAAPADSSGGLGGSGQGVAFDATRSADSSSDHTAPAVPASRATAEKFGHEALQAHLAAQRRREPVSPCHSRPRAAHAADSASQPAGSCELIVPTGP